ELRRRFEGDPPLQELFEQRRAFPLNLAGEKRWVAAEDAARVRDALGVPPPAGLPRELLEPVKDPLGDLVSRWARTHGPFRAEDLASRWGIGVAVVREALERLASQERVLEGEFLPNGRGREWVDAEVLKGLKRRALAKLRKQVEPVDPAALGRFLADWQGIARPRRGLDAPHAASRASLPLAADRSAGQRGPLVAASRGVGNAHRARCRPRTGASFAAWRGHARIGPRGGDRRRLRGGVPGAEGDGGSRTRAPRLLRRRPRGRPVRRSRRRGSAPQLP